MSDREKLTGDEREACPFCSIDRIKADVRDGGDVMIFEPLNPVAPGHLLVVPKRHVESAAADELVAGRMMTVAARWAGRYDSANIITSIGAPATQTVKHLHLHVVPRVEGDGLALPWTEPSERIVAERVAREAVLDEVERALDARGATEFALAGIHALDDVLDIVRDLRATTQDEDGERGEWL